MMNQTRHIPGGVALFAAATLAACSTAQAPSPAPKANAATVSQPVAQVASSTSHFENALNLLQSGDSKQADVELHTYLLTAPDSKPAHDLVAQIETPIDKLLPSDSFVVTLEKDDTLSSLAKTYLGDSLKFYELARYNDIVAPGKVRAGQSIKIPKTVSALAVQRDSDIAAKSDAPEPPKAAPSKSEAVPSAHQLAQAEFKKGLLAFQKQDLDGAIAAWDKALALDPTCKDAELNRAQALRLKEKLKILKSKQG